MKAWRPALGVRARLTLWYVAAMVIVLTMYAAGVFGFVSRSVSDALDARFEHREEPVDAAPIVAIRSRSGRALTRSDARRP